MRPSDMRAIAELLVCVVVGVAAAGCGGRAAQAPPADGERQDSRPRLLTWHGPADASMQALVAGRLRVNDGGCFTVAGEVLMAPPGSRVVRDGGAVRIAGIGTVAAGERVRGGGGYLDAADVQPSKDRRACLSGGGRDTGYVILATPP